MLTAISRTLLMVLERWGGLWLLLLGLCHLAQSASAQSSFLPAPPPPARIVARRGYSSLTFGNDNRVRPRCLHLISDAFNLVDSKGYQCDPMRVSSIRRDPRHQMRLADSSEERTQEEKSLLAKVGALYSRGCCPQISLDSGHHEQSGRLTVSVNATSCRDEAGRGSSNATNGRRGFCFDSLYKCVACCLRSDSQPQQTMTSGGGGGGGGSLVREEDEWLAFHHCVVGCRHSAADAIDQNTFRTLTHHCFEKID